MTILFVSQQLFISPTTYCNNTNEVKCWSFDNISAVVLFHFSSSFPTPPFVWIWNLLKHFQAMSRGLDSCWFGYIVCACVYNAFQGFAKVAPMNHTNVTNPDHKLCFYSSRLLQYSLLGWPNSTSCKVIVSLSETFTYRCLFFAAARLGQSVQLWESTGFGVKSLLWLGGPAFQFL